MSDTPTSTDTLRPHLRGTAGTVIVETARRLFAERGYHGVSVRDIAVETNLSLSALYHYYPGKQDMLFAIIQEAVADFTRVFEAALDSAGTDTLRRFDALIRATVVYRAQHSIESNLVLNELRALTEEQQSAILASRRETSDLLKEVVERGLAEGIFHTPIPAEARRAIFAAVNAIAQWYDPGRTLAVDELERRYIRIARAIVEGPEPVFNVE